MLILASSSPQRKDILKKLNIDFKAFPADIDEQKVEKKFKRPYAMVKAVSLEKAKKIATRYPNIWVLGSDTLVVSRDKKIFAKPKTKNEARKMLNSYQNSFCDVYSGLALINIASGKSFLEYDKTRLFFTSITESVLNKYLKTEQWKYCSGALKIEKASGWITQIKGDYWNVVGLPVEKLKNLLKHIS